MKTLYYFVTVVAIIKGVSSHAATGGAGHHEEGGAAGHRRAAGAHRPGGAGHYHEGPANGNGGGRKVADATDVLDFTQSGIWACSVAPFGTPFSITSIDMSGTADASASANSSVSITKRPPRRPLKKGDKNGVGGSSFTFSAHGSGKINLASSVYATGGDSDSTMGFTCNPEANG